MKKIFSLCLTAGLLITPFTTVTPNPLKAATLDRADFIEITSVEKERDSLTLTWKQVPLAKKYVLIQNGNIIYEGKERSFNHKNLVSGEEYLYFLTALDKNENVITRVNFSTMTLHDNSNKSFDFDTSVNEYGVKLDWEDIPNVSQYSIYKDGEFLTTVQKSDFIDTNIQFKNEYQYHVEGIEKVKDNEGKIKEENHLFMVPVNTMKDYRGTSKEAFVNSASEIGILAVEPVTSFRHRTFIQRESIPLWDGYCYGGDGSSRAFSATSGTHRTQLDISVYWNDLDYGVGKKVSDSKRYSKNSSGGCTTTLVATANEGTSGMLADKRWITSSEAQFTVQHSVGLPFYFSTPPDIDYRYDLNLRKSGMTYINGTQDQYPWHEIYRANNGGSWVSLYTFNPDSAGTNPNYLIPTYDNKTIAVAK